MKKLILSIIVLLFLVSGCTYNQKKHICDEWKTLTRITKDINDVSYRGYSCVLSADVGQDYYDAECKKCVKWHNHPKEPFNPDIHNCLEWWYMFDDIVLSTDICEGGDDECCRKIGFMLGLTECMEKDNFVCGVYDYRV